MWPDSDAISETDQKALKSIPKKEQLENCMNLEAWNHGELESMACFHMLTG